MRTADGSRLKVPEMGWNRVYQTQKHPVWAGVENGAWFYLVHSYFAAPEDMSIVAGMTSYGLPYTSAVARDNIFGNAVSSGKERGRRPEALCELYPLESLIPTLNLIHQD